MLKTKDNQYVRRGFQTRKELQCTLLLWAKMVRAPGLHFKLAETIIIYCLFRMLFKIVLWLSFPISSHSSQSITKTAHPVSKILLDFTHTLHVQHHLPKQVLRISGWKWLHWSLQVGVPHSAHRPHCHKARRTINTRQRVCPSSFILN